MSNQLITLDAAKGFKLELSADVQQAIESALTESALIGKVTSPEQNANAFEAQKKLKIILALIEDTRTAVKEPALEYGRRIDAFAKQASKEILDEQRRLATAISVFQGEEQQRRLAAESLRSKELNEIEQRRQEALAKAKDTEEMNAIQARACEESKALPIVRDSAIKGQVVSEKWEITVTNANELARMHPQCVYITERKREIEKLLDAGLMVHGINAKRVTTSGVRVSRTDLIAA